MEPTEPHSVPFLDLFKNVVFYLCVCVYVFMHVYVRVSQGSNSRHQAGSKPLYSLSMLTGPYLSIFATGVNYVAQSGFKLTISKCLDYRNISL